MQFKGIMVKCSDVGAFKYLDGTRFAADDQGNLRIFAQGDTELALFAQGKWINVEYLKS